MVKGEEVAKNVTKQQKVEEVAKTEEMQGIKKGKVANKAKNRKKRAKNLMVEYLEIFPQKF